MHCKPIGVFLSTGFLLVAGGGCEPAPPTAPRQPPTRAPEPATIGEPDELSDEDALPAGQHRGVAALRPPGDDGDCPERYVAREGVCAHERLIAMQTEADLARSIERYKQGITPQIVADLPAPPPLDPSRMDPGALVRTGPAPEPNRAKAKREEGDADDAEKTLDKLTVDELMAALAARKAAAASGADADEPVREGGWNGRSSRNRNFQTIRDRERVETMDGQLRELAKHMDVLKDVQAATKDGEVTEAEVEQLLGELEGTGSEALVKSLIEVYLKDGLKGVPLDP